AVESLLQRPLFPARTRGHVLLGYVVIFSDPEGAPAGILQNLSNSRTLWWQAAVRTGKSACRFRDRGHSVQAGIPFRQQSRPRWRTECRGMPLTISQAAVGQFLQRWHVDPAAERRPRR